MSEEWRWNNENPSNHFEEVRDDSVQEKDMVQTEVQQEEMENMSAAEEDTEKVIPLGEESKDETYHWVNPEYQKRQQEGTASTQENTYQNTNYRDDIGSEKKTESGYYGGSYHSDWRNQQKQNQEFKAAQQSAYSKYQLDEETPVKEKRVKDKNGTGKKLLKTVAFAVVFGVVAGCVMFGVNKAANYFWGDESKNEPVKQVSSVQLQQSDASKDKDATSNNSSGNGYSVAEVAENCMPSVVSITNASVTTVKNYFGGVQEYVSESSGSGIIVGQNEEELLIATNNHVVDGAETLTVAFCDESVYQAQTKGTASDVDLAVIAVKLSDMTEESLEAIRIIQIGDSEDLQIGEQVVAIGNALGYGQSVTSGWVSALNREMQDEDGNTMDCLIQTDAAINPGNSGGALLNMRGELIGINSAKTSDTKVEGMGYAISIAKAEPILNELMNLETRYKVDTSVAAYIGVTCYNVEASVSQIYGIPTGAFIESVEEGGPAQKAGIKRGDVIVKFDNHTITSSTELVELLEYYEAGEVVEVVVARAETGEYKEITLTATLGNKNNMKQTER